MHTKNCQKCKNDFAIEDEDQNFYQMVKVPEPTFCPTCRLIRRLSFRNDRVLFKRTCDMRQKEVISIYHPDGGYKVVCQKCWWSDDFDTTKYGKEYDFSRSFFEQFDELMHEVPLVANFIVDESRMVNSPYNNMVLDLRNCYLLFNADFNEDCAYGCSIENSKNCLDTTLIHKSEMLYECVNCQNCYRVFYSVDCESSSDVWFSRDCNGCTDCFGCVGLRKQQYQIFNEQYTKEGYEEKLKAMHLGLHAGIEKAKSDAYAFWGDNVTKYMHEKQNEGVSGDYIYNSKNVQHSWIVHEGWNLKYCQYLVAAGTKDSYDFTQFGNNAELHYEVLQSGNSASNIRFSWFTPSENRELDYCIQTMTSHDMFGCIGLRKNEYCILNKQYSKEEYENLRAKIIEQMKAVPYRGKGNIEYRYGEFFPSDLSPFAYNETTAHEYYPLSSSTAKDKGFIWREPDDKKYSITMPLSDIPDTIAEVAEDITKEIIECANEGDKTKNCTKAFRVIPDEVGFYRRMNLPIPHKCPNCRHKERLAFRNPPILREGVCAIEGCGEIFETAYSLGTRHVLCKKHYLERVA